MRPVYTAYSKKTKKLIELFKQEGKKVYEIHVDGKRYATVYNQDAALNIFYDLLEL